MYEQFEIAGYKITTDSSLNDERDHITPGLKWEIEKLYPHIQKGNKTIIRKLLHLIERHPENPQLKNYLSSAYAAVDDYKKSVQINELIVKEHPDYLFGLLNKAFNLIENGETDLVPEILGRDMELKALYPERKEFHLSEFTSFYKLLVFYYAAIGDLEQAKISLEMIKKAAPDHPDTEIAGKHFLYKQMESGFKKLTEEDKTKIKVKVRGIDQNDQTQIQPEFNHSEIEWLYKFDSRISEEKLKKIINLPRPSLIDDLKTVLNDIIIRYEYFKKLDDSGMLTESKNFFGCHAVYILCEIEAVEALPALLNSLKYDSDFLNFWFFDLLTESFWYPIMNLGKNRLDELMDFVLTPNLDTYARAEVTTAVVQMALHYPERRGEVIQWMRKIINVLTESDPESGLVDSDFFALIVSDLVYIQGVELLPEIEKLYNLDYISHGIAGPYESLKRDLSRKLSFDPKRSPFSIFKEYEDINNVMIKGKSDYVSELSQSPKNKIQSTSKQTPKIGRNEPCPCGSGKKYKRCCINS